MRTLQQLQMYHEFLPLMGRKRPVEDPLTAEKTFEEIESAAKEVGTFQTEYRSSKVSNIRYYRHWLIRVL